METGLYRHGASGHDLLTERCLVPHAGGKLSENVSGPPHNLWPTKTEHAARLTSRRRNEANNLSSSERITGQAKVVLVPDNAEYVIFYMSVTI
jgi:hypothetical protein